MLIHYKPSRHYNVYRKVIFIFVPTNEFVYAMDQIQIQFLVATIFLTIDVLHILKEAFQYRPNVFLYLQYPQLSQSSEISPPDRS